MTPVHMTEHNDVGVPSVGGHSCASNPLAPDAVRAWNTPPAASTDRIRAGQLAKAGPVVAGSAARTGPDAAVDADDPLCALRPRLDVVLELSLIRDQLLSSS